MLTDKPTVRRIIIDVDITNGNMSLTGPIHDKYFCTRALVDALKSILDAEPNVLDNRPAITVPGGRSN